MRVALVHEVFPTANDAARLRDRLERAAAARADLAVLPELPLNGWAPATRDVRDDDAEPPDGPRFRAQADAAREAGIALLGGVIRRDPRDGRRTNRALLFDRTGTLRGEYDKLHVPCEAGFWEADHYTPGDTLPAVIDGFPLGLGLQICSDLQRPVVCQLLGARGAGVIFAPRATPPASYERWKTVILANAITSATYVVSVNRPAPEGGVAIGGPSLVAGPDGHVVCESTEPLAFVDLDPAAVEQARRDYPGYLDVRAALYARGWSELAR